ncbi:unnamed protein product [Closterium sp. Naga37s-1]|nr:unnamed protein product [Closterium sp. Naga37s-1]
MSSLYLTDSSPSSLFPPSSLRPPSVLSPSSLRPLSVFPPSSLPRLPFRASSLLLHSSSPCPLQGASGIAQFHQFNAHGSSKELHLAKELVRWRRAIGRMHEQKAQTNSLSSSLLALPFTPSPPHISNPPASSQGSSLIHLAKELVRSRKAISRMHVTHVNPPLLNPLSLPLFLPLLPQHLAKELVRSRKAISRMHEQKAQMNSISLHLGENIGEWGVQEEGVDRGNECGGSRRDHALKAQMNSISLCLGEGRCLGENIGEREEEGWEWVALMDLTPFLTSMAKVAGHMAKSADVMKLINMCSQFVLSPKSPPCNPFRPLPNPPAMAKVAEHMAKTMAKVAEHMAKSTEVMKLVSGLTMAKVAGHMAKSTEVMKLVSGLIKVPQVVAMAKVAGHMAKSTEVMKLVSGLIKVPQVAGTMQELSKEMMKAGLISEMLEKVLDNALDTEEMEDEMEEERSTTQFPHLSSVFPFVLPIQAGLISEMLEEAVDDALDTEEMEGEMEEEVIRFLMSWRRGSQPDFPAFSPLFTSSSPCLPVQAGLISEMLEEAVDDALDTEEMEDEMEEEVNKVLDELATEATAQLPTAVRQKQRAAEAAGVEEEDERVPQMEMGLGADDEAELARLKAKYK